MAAAAATDGDGGSAPSANSAPSSGGLLGQSIIDELTPPANVHLDDTGENRLKKLQPVIDALRNLGPLFDKWKQCPVGKGGWDQASYGPGVEAQQIPPLNTINFGAIYSPYARMNQMHSAGQALESIAQNGADALPQYWAGAAADAATTKLNDLKYASQEYTQTLESLSPHVMGLWTTTTNAVQKLADFADSGDGKAIVQAGKDASGKGADLGHDMTNDSLNSYIDQINLAVKNGLYAGWNWEPASSPGDASQTVSPQQLRNPGVCELDGGHGSWWSNEAASWFDKFADTYNSAVKNLRAQITQTYQAVDQALSDFTGQISSIPADPFGKLQAPGAPPAPSGSNNGSNNGSGGGSHPGGSPSTGSGGGSGSGGGGGGGTSAASFTPPPISPSTVGGGGSGAGAGGGTGSTPGQGGLPTIPPISTPGSPVSTPVGSTTTQGAQGTPESMTVQSGSNQISMTSPDSQGNVQLTVHNGTGTQSYNIGFGGQGTGAPGVPGQAIPGQAAPQQITPGANGAAVIHDGNLTITATEPQGGHGPVQVTVDDGTGHPSTYTLNPGSGAAGGAPTQPLAGTTPAGAPYPGSADTQGGYGIPAAAGQQGYAVPASGQSYGGDPSAYTSGAAYQTGATYDPSTDPSTAAAATYQPDAGTQSAAWLPPAGDPSSHADAASNLTQGFGGGVGGGGGAALAGHASFGGAVSGAPISPADHTGGMVSSAASNHEVSGVGLANTNVEHPGAPGGAGVADGPGDTGGQQAGGGMPMMGGMGGMGGSSGQEQERGGSQWRVRGDLFGGADGPLEVPRVIGDEDR